MTQLIFRHYQSSRPRTKTNNQIKFILMFMKDTKLHTNFGVFGVIS